MRTGEQQNLNQIQNTFSIDWQQLKQYLLAGRVWFFIFYLFSSSKPEELEGDTPLTMEPSVVPPGMPSVQQSGQFTPTASEKGKQQGSIGKDEKNITEDKTLPEPTDMKQKEKEPESTPEKEKATDQEKKHEELAKLKIPEEEVATEETDKANDSSPRAQVEEHETTEDRKRPRQTGNMPEEAEPPPGKKSKAD